MKMKTLTLNGTAYQVCDPAAVSFEEQTLSQEQKMQARQNLGIPEKTYELIEDVTLQEDVSGFVRTADPNGVAYNFSAVRICITAAANPNAGSSAQIILQVDGNKSDYMIYHQATGSIATSERVTTLVARNDHGMLDYYVSSGSVNSPTTNSSRPAYLVKQWSNVSRINLFTYPSGTVLPAGSRIRIYAVRG